MLDTNLQGHRLFGYREEYFSRFLPYMGMAAMLVMSPGSFEQTFIPTSLGGSTCNLASIGLAVSKEKKIGNVVNLSDLGPRAMIDLGL